MSEVSEILESLDNYIEFAEGRNIFSDAIFYKRIKALLSSHAVIDKEDSLIIQNIMAEMVEPDGCQCLKSSEQPAFKRFTEETDRLSTTHKGK